LIEKADPLRLFKIGSRGVRAAVGARLDPDVAAAFVSEGFFCARRRRAGTDHGGCRKIEQKKQEKIGRVQVILHPLHRRRFCVLRVLDA
jgi:hypothetical protein